MVAVQFFKDLTRPTVTPPPAAAGVRVRRTLYSVKFDMRILLYHLPNQGVCGPPGACSEFPTQQRRWGHVP